MTKQEKQALAKISLKNKNTKEGKELASLLTKKAGDAEDVIDVYLQVKFMMDSWKGLEKMAEKNPEAVKEQFFKRLRDIAKKAK